MESNFLGRVLYSIFNVLAYTSAGIIFYAEAKRKKFTSEKLLYIIFAALLGALIGSRLGSALFVYRDFYAQNPLALFSAEAGGKTIIGGLIGGYTGVVIAKRILKISRSTGDLFAPGLALGIAIGRIGCFLNGCCYGIATSLPWGLVYKGIKRHPTQIYESLFCFALFIFLWRIRKNIKQEGDLFKIFLLAYTFFRFWVEFLRADVVKGIFNLSIAQAICAAVFTIVAFSFLKRRREHGKESL